MRLRRKKEGLGKAISIFVGCIAVLLLCSSMFPQGNAGRILGGVKDPTGAMVPGVMISIRDVDRGTTRTVTTDEAGLYNAPNLLPGTYTVRAEFPGFATVERQNTKLEVGQDIRVDITI